MRSNKSKLWTILILFVVLPAIVDTAAAANTIHSRRQEHNNNNHLDDAAANDVDDYLNNHDLFNTLEELYDVDRIIDSINNRVTDKNNGKETRNNHQAEEEQDVNNNNVPLSSSSSSLDQELEGENTKNNGFPQNCSLCKYEDSIVGSPDLIITNISANGNTKWTCDLLQHIGKEVEYDEGICKIIQNYATYCNCTNSTSSSTLETNSLSSSHENGNKQDDEDEDNGKKEFLAKILTNVFLFLLVFGLSASVPVRQLRKQLTNVWALVTGCAMQFLIMPLMGFISIMFFKAIGSDDFTKSMGLTLMVVTASPGGSYSNWWCSLFNADLALSMAMTAVSTIISLGALPINLLIYSHLAYGMHDDGADNVVQALDFKALFLSLGIVMTALLSGLFSSYMLENKTFMTWANRGASLSGIALILASMFLSTGGDESFFDQDWKFYVGVAFPCFMGLILSNVFCQTCVRLKNPECVAIAIECCYQNIGIATSVAITMFSDRNEQAQALAVPIFYGLVQTILVGSYSVLSWKLGWTYSPPNESLCTVISTSYQIQAAVEEKKSLKEDCGSSKLEYETNVSGSQSSISL